MNLSLTNSVTTPTTDIDFDELVSYIQTTNTHELIRDIQRDRAESIVTSLEQLSDSDRDVVIDFLRRDEDFANLTGDDSSCYMATLKSNLNISNEFITAGVAAAAVLYAAASAGIGFILEKYRDGITRLEKRIREGGDVTDEQLKNVAASSKMLKAEAFSKNHMVLMNTCKTITTILKKTEIDDKDVAKIATALDLKKPEQTSTGKQIGGGVAAWFIGGTMAQILGAAPATLIAAAGVASPASLVLIPLHMASLAAGWAFGIRVGKNIASKHEYSIAQLGWTASKLATARKQALEEIAAYNALESAGKNKACRNKMISKTLSNTCKLIANALQGQCISVAAIYRTVEADGDAFNRE